MAGKDDDILISVSTDLTQIKRRLRELGQSVTSTTAGVQKTWESTGRAIDRSIDTSGVQKRINEMVGVAQRGAKEWQGALAEQGKALDDLRKKYNPLYAAQQQYLENLKDIKTANAVGAISTNEMAAAITAEKAAFAGRVAYITSANKTLKETGAVARLTSNQMLNLSRQGNDVITMFALGAPPMQIFASQAGQIYDALEQGNGGVRGSLKAIGLSIAGFITPMGAATAALALGVAGFIAYKVAGVESVDKLDDILKHHAENIKLLGDAYEQVMGKQQKFSVINAQTANLISEGDTKKLKDRLRADIQNIFTSATDVQLNGDFTEEVVKAKFAPFEKAIKALNESAKDTTALRAFVDTVTEMAAANPQYKDAANSLLDLAKTALDTAQSLPEVTRTISDVDAAFGKLQNEINQIDNEPLKKALTDLREKAQKSGISVEDVNKALDVLGDKNMPLLNVIKPLQELYEAAIKARDALGSIKLNDNLGQLSPLYSGGGQFLNDQQRQTFDAMQSRLNGIADSMAAKMLKTFEGFIAHAKWDTNAYRVGFGSDTVTRANGQIEKVTKDTIVTLEDAQRDLSRRIIEFQNGIQNAIGIDTWRSLTEAQQAALTSIAYNYGQLPKSIVKAIQSGGGPEIVARAIASLTANPTRRKEEAQAYLNGTGISMGEAGLGNKKSPDELFKGDQEAIQRRIDLLNAQFDAQQKLNPLIKDYGFQVEQARIYQELLNDAQKRGVKVTPEMDEGLKKLAASYAAATSARNQLTEAQQIAANAAKQGSEFGKEILGGFIQDLRNGKTAAEALANALNKVADKILEMALNGLFGLGPGGNGLGGPLSFIGQLFGGLFRANGGPVEAGQPYIVGEKRPELFVPNVSGRIVPRVPTATSGGSMVGGGSVHVTVGVAADGNGNLMPFVQSVARSEASQSTAMLSRQVPKMVDARTDTRNVRKTRA